MNLMELMSIIIMLAVISLVASATAGATQDFRDDQSDNSSYAYNISQNSLKGIDNASGYFDNIGTFAGIAALLGVIYLLFTGFKMQQ